MVCPIKVLHFGCDGKDWIHKICNFSLSRPHPQLCHLSYLSH